MFSPLCIAVVFLAVASEAFPAPQPNVIGYTSRTVFTPGMQHPMQTYNVEYSVPVDTSSFYSSYYPQVPQQMPAQPAAHDRQRRQIGFGGLGGGMAGASAQAQSQSMGTGMGMGGMGLGGLGINPYMGVMPFIG